MQPDGTRHGYYPEPTPWAAGLAVAIFVGVLAAVAVYAFGVALAEVPHVGWLLAVVVNVIAVGGVTPTVWRWRHIVVTRWVLGGVAAGVVLGWLVLLIAAFLA
ncbi:DUF2537 domain-containing protein [Nocardia sp. alder85J]|uniref:DUF2537 domain-containing protein n=1 Tax=Nocardia sp. alder85J TaxID=2862949 RepID=UPI001CD346B3|nr:DUF2537 domain-containing protein [Nocardia sp. alder85J]MCX4093297.1 DUF2537 domain-containing protein [Nocardia sp. alder85J]